MTRDDLRYIGTKPGYRFLHRGGEHSDYVCTLENLTPFDNDAIHGVVGGWGVFRITYPTTFLRSCLFTFQHDPEKFFPTHKHTVMKQARWV